MAGQSQQSGGLIAGINVTPLVDIMLVLLIIFLVTAKLVTTPPPQGLPLDLPKSATGDAVQLIFAVTLYAGGEVAVNGERLASDADIVPKARAAKTEHPEVRAIVQADGKVFHERVVHAVDLLSQAGITQIAFGVLLSPQPAATGGP